MDKCHLIVDVARCENCCNCLLAVKDEYDGNDFPGYSAAMPHLGHNWFYIKETERGSGSMLDVAYLPVTCNQCANPPCVRAAKDGAVTQREDGIVIIDPKKAQGQKQLVKSCPYGHIWWNEDKRLPQKYSFDAHLLDGSWDVPRVVQTCGPMALSFVKCSDHDMEARAEREGLKTLHPEFGTKPRIWYKNLHRFYDAFIAGSVSVTENDLRECADGASVMLSKNGERVGNLTTDHFGDFKFDKLPTNSGEYQLTVELANHKPKSIDINLQKSVYLGEIHLG